MLDQNNSNTIAHLTICRHGPLLKIASKIYNIILVKKSGWTKYDLTVTGELTICWCGPRQIIVSNSFFVSSENYFFGPNTFQ